MLYPLRWLLSAFSTLLRLGAGRATGRKLVKVELPILYEFAACPWCRIARETISEAGLSVLVRPCPKGGERFRPKVAELGGKAQFPFFIDEFVPDGMYESADVSMMVRKHYGAGRPLLHWLGPLNGVLSSCAVLLGFTGGRRVKLSKAQSQPLELYGSEANPGARLVKARLCSLQLEYIWHPSSSGKPRLSDPETGKIITGGRESLQYLSEQYGRWS